MDRTRFLIQATCYDNIAEIMESRADFIALYSKEIYWIFIEPFRMLNSISDFIYE